MCITSNHAGRTGSQLPAQGLARPRLQHLEQQRLPAQRCIAGHRDGASARSARTYRLQGGGGGVQAASWLADAGAAWRGWLGGGHSAPLLHAKQPGQQVGPKPDSVAVRARYWASSTASSNSRPASPVRSASCSRWYPGAPWPVGYATPSARPPPHGPGPLRRVSTLKQGWEVACYYPAMPAGLSAVARGGKLRRCCVQGGLVSAAPLMHRPWWFRHGVLRQQR